jgi:hypothetical protein
MEWQLPIQKVEIGNINIGSPWARGHVSKEFMNKPMAPLSYFGTQFRLPFVSLIFPPLPVVEYNHVTGKLVLDISETSLANIKLKTLQDTIINAIVYHQSGWFKSDFSKEEIAQGFQPIINDNHLILHCPIITSPRAIPFYKGGWKNTFTADDLTVGTRIRIAVKIHGISFLNRNEQASGMKWSGKCRLQHRILGVIAVV